MPSVGRLADPHWRVGVVRAGNGVLDRVDQVLQQGELGRVDVVADVSDVTTEIVPEGPTDVRW